MKYEFDFSELEKAMVQADRRHRFQKCLEIAKLVVATVLMLLLLMIIAAGSVANAQSKESIKAVIRDSAIRHGIDPDLAIAIGEVESGLNPNRVGALGERGPFQLHPKYHKTSTEVCENVETAMRYLVEIKSKWEPVYGEAWFIAYNLGPNYRKLRYPTRFPYFLKVMSVQAFHKEGR